LRLQQILTNLISNATKFTDSGGVILVSVKPSRASTDDPADATVMLSFSVKDTGTGIAPEYRDLLFEPFSQADTSSTRKYEGTGLGLSICKQLVTMMHGTIGVESELGRGSIFFFTVRLNYPADKSISKPVVPPDIQGLTVLVVDDLADSRLIMRKMLESLGFRVETLSSGMDALSRLKDNQMRNYPIELIMMDWKMPQMDGIEASRKIRQEMQLSMPIIMMTAFGKEEQRIQAQQVGINGFLIKPIYPSTLFDAIMDGFGKGRARDTDLKRHFTTRASIYRTPLKGLHMLVAEDNPTNQQVAQGILEGAGIEVTIVGNGEEAVEAVGNHAFDAVLMDIQMPKMNGYEATRQIRALPRGSTIPIVAMTAHAMKGDEEKCLEAGMDGYISKPVNQDRLFHTLWRLLRSTKGAFEELLSADEAATAAMATENDTAPDLGATDESAGSSLPDTMPGIDIKASLASLNIDGATLARIMTGFLADNRQTTQGLRQTLADNDLESLRQLAHSLKGSAANIGALDLSQAAYTLEDACRKAAANGENERSALGPLIDDVVTALDQVLASIQSLETPVADEKGPTAPVMAQSLTTSIGVLTDAIEKADPEAVEAILPDFKRQARQSDLVDPSILAALEAQIERYDYDQALDTIRKLDMHRS
jgi:CheY-like chemotaxis protein